VLGPPWTDASVDRGHGGAPKLTGEGAKWRGEQGELGSGLTGARRDIEEAGRRRCRMGRRRHSVRRLLRRGEREIGAGRGAVKLGEGARLFYWPGERQGGVAGVVNASINGFNAIEDGPA
jgi:hypothetical protein